jgi:hypothetical protein
MMALPDCAALGGEMHRLPLGLDAFSHGLEAKAFAERDQRADDRGVFRIFLDVTDEAAVNLDDVDREPLEVGERGIAGAEIV